MDILVMVEENSDQSSVLAHVNSIPAPLHGSERPSRDIVTVYGQPTPETVALAKDCGPNIGAVLDVWHWHHSGGTTKDILDAGVDRIEIGRAHV